MRPRPAFCATLGACNAFGRVSPPIGQGLAGDALEGFGCTLCVLDGAGVVAEVELADVALEVLRADVLVDASDAALEDAVIVLDGVGVPEAAAHVFLDRVIDRAMACVLAAGLLVDARFVGHQVGLAVDLWRHATPARALMLARAMEPFNLLWIEDPFAPNDAASMRYLRDAIEQPLLTGETLPTRREFTDLFERRAVDIINPDICLSGILEIQVIAAMAEPAYITVSPHNSNSMALGTSAAIHASAGIPNLSPVEYFPLFETALDDVCTGRPHIEGGEVSIPDTPGLGVIFDDDAMAAFRV